MNSIPQLPKFLTIEDNYARLTPVGELRLEDAVDIISEAILHCRGNEIEGLLVDARGLYGFSQPSVVDRYWFARKWATESAGTVVLSFIQRPEMIDPEKIGTTISANAGLVANVFDTEEEALDWLAANVRVNVGK
jgi:hypothetical protein